MPKVTTASFIKRSTKSHSNKYDYSLSEYISSNLPVKIICPIHGLFEQMPSGHMQGEGCNKCGCEATAAKRRVSHEEFLKRLYNKFPNFPYKFLSDCKGLYSPISLEDKHGLHEMLPASILRGSAPSFRSATNKNLYFINKAREIHGNTYSYDRFEYTLYGSKSKITCLKHGDFLQSAMGHLDGDGCPRCGGERVGEAKRYTRQEFIERANEKHSSFYSYDKLIYTTATDKIIVTCPKHGDFKILPSGHLQGTGCSLCGRDKTNLANYENPHGWGLTAWKKNAKSSKYFDSYKVYFVKLSGEEENFYKVGRTYNTIKRRFKNDMPYAYELIHVISSNDPSLIFNLENHLQRIFKKYKYTPKKTFDGKSECFYFDNQNLISSVIREMSDYST